MMMADGREKALGRRFSGLLFFWLKLDFLLGFIALLLLPSRDSFVCRIVHNPRDLLTYLVRFFLSHPHLIRWYPHVPRCVLTRTGTVSSSSGSRSGVMCDTWVKYNTSQPNLIYHSVRLNVDRPARILPTSRVPQNSRPLSCRVRTASDVTLPYGRPPEQTTPHVIDSSVPLSFSTAILTYFYLPVRH